MAGSSWKKPRGKSVQRITVIEVDGYLTKFWEIFNHVAALEMGPGHQVEPGTVGALSDYTRMVGGGYKDFVNIRQALRQFPVLWASPAQMPKAREWTPDPHELIIYHVRRFQMAHAEPALVQTIRWFERVFNITNPPLWYEEDRWVA